MRSIRNTHSSALPSIPVVSYCKTCSSYSCKLGGDPLFHSCLNVVRRDAAWDVITLRHLNPDLAVAQSQPEPAVVENLVKLPMTGLVN
jgi:hypothetical protein